MFITINTFIPNYICLGTTINTLSHRAVAYVTFCHNSTIYWQDVVSCTHREEGHVLKSESGYSECHWIGGTSNPISPFSCQKINACSRSCSWGGRGWSLQEPACAGTGRLFQWHHGSAAATAPERMGWKSVHLACFYTGMVFGPKHTVLQIQSTCRKCAIYFQYNFAVNVNLKNNSILNPKIKINLPMSDNTLTCDAQLVFVRV